MMEKKADVYLNNGTLHVSGDLDFYNLMTVYRKSLSLLSELKDCRCDFSELRSSDSTGVVLMIEWIKWAREHSKPIQFCGVPEKLQSIIKVAGLETLMSW